MVERIRVRIERFGETFCIQCVIKLTVNVCMMIYLHNYILQHGKRKMGLTTGQVLGSSQTKRGAVAVAMPKSHKGKSTT